MNANKKRRPIGRRLDGNLNLLNTDLIKAQSFTLASGATASFSLIHIVASELETATEVNQMINIREQNLTAESLKEISDTLQFQQFFPAIGRRLTSGKIDILDGSRRRAAALLINKGLDILVTEDEISSSDARALAKAIQTAKEHSLREIGLRLKAMLEQSDITQNILAKQEGLSEAKVTRALHAAQTPAELVELFPNRSLLTYVDYRKLLEISESVEDFDTFLARIHDEKGKLDLEQPDDLYKKKMMKLIKSCGPQPETKSKPVEEVRSLWQFDNKNNYARCRTKERQLQFEFNRLPKTLEKRLEQAIKKELEAFYQHEQ